MKRITAWLLVVLGVAGIVASYYGVWVLVAYFAAGLWWPIALSVFVSGPVAAFGALLALRVPRQRAAATMGGFGFGAWILLWVLMFAAGFRFI